ncbi:substrate-binding domain-containing protein [Zobellia alginiliquefaciens]|uniref:substrate-binding domain-containing protein n=1 Tax=Zobellia alginiliquefaciens TaxID=3032586 RepID=UPI0023E427C7|nr:LacI family DNA-binding transcriptional regulator [Zobellia alginiliquefaciens]
MEKNYTIKDIAQLAGVSKGTVDRVIHKRGRVSTKAADKVNAVLAKIEYKPNPIAKSLKNNKVYRISILLPKADTDPFWQPCYSAITQVEKEFGHFGIKLEQWHFNPEDTQTFITAGLKAIKSKPVAILMVPLFFNEAENLIKKCSEAKIKVATFNNYIKQSKVDLFIGQDLNQSGRVAASLFNVLLQKNSTIAVLHIDEVFQNASHMQEKECGFKGYFSTKNIKNFRIQVHNLKKESGRPFENTIEHFVKTNANALDGIFVTTSKAYLLADQIANHTNKTIIIGYDLVADNITHLTNQNISFLIHQDPKKQVYLSLTYLIEHFLFDNPLREEQLLPIDIVNAENYSQYLT